MSSESENRPGTPTAPVNYLGMTDEEFDAWLAEEDPEPPPPSAYSLVCDGGRRGFLEAYIWRGEAALFEAVNHMWDSLNPPKAVHCALIGLMAGSGGTGKCALIRFLRKGLREALDDGLVQPTSGYGDIHEFHAASMTYFEASYAHYLNAVQKYADLMNGGPDDVPHKCLVIHGPWLSNRGE
jgi:hypothetical protein